MLAVYRTIKILGFVLIIFSFQNCGESPFSESGFQSSDNQSKLECDSKCETDNNKRPDLSEERPEDYSAVVEIGGDLDAYEGETIEVEFRLSEQLDHDVRISYRLEQSSAFAGSDFRYKEGQVTIRSGESTATVQVLTLFDEDAFEQDESFYMVVGAIQGEARRPQPAVLKISEDPEQLLARGSQSSQIGLGEYTSCALLQLNNTLYNVEEGSLDTNDEMRCWGKHPAAVNTPAAVNAIVPYAVVGGLDFMCYGYPNGVECFGSKVSNGQMPAQPFSSGRAHALAAGNDHACAIMGSERRLYCWGYNAFGQVAAAATTGYVAVHAVSFQVNGQTVDSNIQAVTAGSNHTCAIVRGQLFCWGSNSGRQIGVSSASAHYVTPQPVVSMSAGVTGVAAGREHTCAIKDNAAYCWGDNSLGQLGNGTSNTHTVPAPVENLDGFEDIRRITSGNDHTCVLNYDGAMCWGDSRRGQVGTRTPNASIYNTASMVSNLTGFISDIAAGGDHTCAIFKTQSGEVRSQVACWGKGENGQIGNGSTNDVHQPIAINLEVLSHFNSQAAESADINYGSVDVGDGSGGFTSGDGFGLKPR